MQIDIFTKQDAEEFRLRLLEDIKALIGGERDQPTKWIKSFQVKNMLKISPNTLQKLRLDGTLKPTKIGGILYYNYNDIMDVLNGKIKAK